VIYRCGRKYAVYIKGFDVWIYDDATGDTSRVMDARTFFPNDLGKWECILYDDEAPDGLLAHLILKFRPKT
jgi:hypothetical protein